jgi:transposase
MKFIIGKNWNRVEIVSWCLDDTIGPINEVRLIDFFVDSLPLDQMGLKPQFIENGSPAHHPSDLLKLLIYAYLNRVRWSCLLEAECRRNLEVIWLMKGLRSHYDFELSQR